MRNVFSASSIFALSMPLINTLLLCCTSELVSERSEEKKMKNTHGSIRIEKAIKRSFRKRSVSQRSSFARVSIFSTEMQVILYVKEKSLSEILPRFFADRLTYHFLAKTRTSREKSAFIKFKMILRCAYTVKR